LSAAAAVVVWKAPSRSAAVSMSAGARAIVCVAYEVS
jgi:hypothetical protein